MSALNHSSDLFKNPMFCILNLFMSVLIKLVNSWYHFWHTNDRNAQFQALSQFPDVIDSQDFHSSLHGDYYYLGLYDFMQCQNVKVMILLRNVFQNCLLHLPRKSFLSTQGCDHQDFPKSRMVYSSEGKLLSRGTHSQKYFLITQFFSSVPCNNHHHQSC